MIREIFNCLPSHFVLSLFLRKTLLHCMKQTDSLNVSYALCRYPVIPVAPCTQSYSVCKPRLVKPQLLLLQSSLVLWGSEQSQFWDALGQSLSGGYVRGQRVWHHTSISGNARDCDLEQVTSPAVKVQTSLCKEELWCFNPFRNKGLFSRKACFQVLD